VSAALSFWAFSTAIYADPDVQAECLALQDNHDIDVNLLLFCAYVGARHGVVLREAELREADAQVRKWQNDIIQPVRKVRKTLKAFATLASPVASSAAALREQIKRLELEAERIEQSMLEDWGVEHLRACQRGEAAVAITENVRTLLTLYEVAEHSSSLPGRLIATSLTKAFSGTNPD
jgi:uncharacterized protein (TIGR02444 family)